MPPLRRQAFVYLTAALATGIAADLFFRSALLSVAWIAGSAALCSAALWLHGKEKALFGIVVLAAFSAGGALLSMADRSRVSPTRLKRLYEQGMLKPSIPVTLTGTLARPPEPAPDRALIEADSESVEINGQVVEATGRARLMLRYTGRGSESDLRMLGLEYGARIRVLVSLEQARRFKNPGSRDLNDFLELKGYDLQGVVTSPRLIENLGRGRSNPILSWLYEIRLRGIEALQRSFEPPVSGTLTAMLFGNRHFMDRRTADLLRAGGTFHVLSISGMHVGIIALALLGRFSLKRRKRSRVIVALLCLWAYAVMVGLAPPVVRATVMITAGLIGWLLFRRAASLNTVSLAAFLMLVHNPILVTDAGFQLSFAAVAGIVAIALPIQDRLRRIGEWQPSAHTPHPPICSRFTRKLAEALFWDEPAFRREMRTSVLRFLLDKSSASRLLSRARLQTALRWTFLMLLTSVAVQLTTLPLTIYYFNRAAPAGIVLNVLAGPLTALLMFAGIGALVLDGVAVPARMFAIVGKAAHGLLAYSVIPFLDLPGMSFRVPHYEGAWALLYLAYCGLIVMLCVLIDRWSPVEWVLPARSTGARPMLGPPPRRLWLICSLCFATALALVLQPTPRLGTQRLVVHFLDVGQGDSALVVFPAGTTMLVDGGGEPRFTRGGVNDGESQGSEIADLYADSSLRIGEAVVSRFLWSRGLTSLDYVLATHEDSDHIGGLSDVLENFRIGQLVVGAAPGAAARLDRLARMAETRRVSVGRVQSGDRFEVDGVGVEILWPPEDAAGSGNDESVVVRLVYGSVAVLMTGDIEHVAEGRLVESGVTLRADVIKVPHHGSKTSSGEPFLEAVSPSVAVFSVGELSRFGHPHDEVVGRYRALGTRILTTGVSGMVTVETDGRSLSVRTHSTGSG